MGSIPVGTTNNYVNKLEERLLLSLFFVFSQPLVNGSGILALKLIFDFIRYNAAFSVHAVLRNDLLPNDNFNKA